MPVRVIRFVFFFLTAVVCGCTHADALKPSPANPAALAELIEFLKLPNITTRSTADIQANAVWLENAFKRHGFIAQQLEDGETPMVFAAAPNPSKKLKTVLFYAHMDGQPVDPARWEQDDPFKPVLKQKSATGAWETISLDQLQGPIDPDWRLFARSASDDKGPIIMFIAAMDELRKAGVKPAINIKMIVDSHEEGGGAPGALNQVIRRNAELLGADVVVMMDGPMHASNKPTLVFGHRGSAGVTLKVFGPRGDMHSGHFGNYTPNPAMMLAEILASLKDDKGRVVVPGFYEGVSFSAEDRAAFAGVPDDEAALKQRLGIALPDAVGASYQEAINYPSLNVRGLSTGLVGGAPGTIIPESAIAYIDMRTVPATPGARQFALVKNFIAAQGYHLVDQEPTDAERAAYPKIASVRGGGGGAALQTDLASPLGVWARKALLAAHGEEPVRIRMMGGSVPSEPLVEELGKPIILLPLVNADNNQHAANENLRLGNFSAGVETLKALFTTKM